MAPSPRLSYAFGAFRLDAAAKVLFREDEPVPLTPKAAETLLALVERHGHVVTKEELFRIVWPDTFVEENNLAQNISGLRRVLGQSAGGGHVIETVPKRGYRFVGPVAERIETEQAPAAALVQPIVQAPPGGSSVSEAAQGSARRRAVIWAAIAAALVTFVVVAGSRTGERPPESSAVPMSPSGAGATRMAVLPFVNLGSPDDAYFVAGLTEEITSRLAGVSRLAVLSSTTAAQYDRRGKSVRRIGADLGVEYVVEGSVRWAQDAAGKQVRITPKVIRVADDMTVWTQQYDASLSDLFGVHADIAYQITGALQVALAARERRIVQARPTSDTDAYLAYLRGIASYQQATTDTALQARARVELEDAVARDPRFAQAWSWLARVYGSQYRTGAQRTPATREAAYRAAQRAVDLDPGLSDGHFALAWVSMGDRDWERARRELDIARVGLPNSPEAWQMVAFIEQRQGRWAEASTAFMRAFDFDPASTADLIGVQYLHLRQYGEARRFIEIARAANRTAAVVPDAWRRFSESGDVAAARPVLESALGTSSPADGRVRGLLARLEWFDGRHQRALELIEGMEQAGAWMPPNFRFPASIAAGQVYESMGRHRDAAKSYAAALADLQHRQRSAPEDHQIEAALALAARGLGRGREAVQHAERAVELQSVAKDATEGPLYLYLLAQIYALFGNHAAAFATLDEMFSVPGFYNEQWVQRDPGFTGLRSQPAFRAYIEKWSLQKGDALLGRHVTPRLE